MSKNNPYRPMIARHADLLREGATLPLGGLKPLDRPSPAADAPKALIFSPHPDDECIIGGLPLRLLRELGMKVINVAVTLGSRRDRQAERWHELEGACNYIGFGLLPTAERGLEKINLATREQRAEDWAAAMTAIGEILEAEQPDIVFMPHDDDWNSTHIGTHHLVIDALARMPQSFTCQVIETEFWGAMARPNLMVESSADDVADLVAALSFHVGEVTRNPFHLRLPAWMIDNVRRGSELVQGQGGAAPDMTFATLYRLRRWADGLQDVLPVGQVLSAADDLAPLLA